MKQSDIEFNCFIKQGKDLPWVPAIKKPDGDFANAYGFLLTEPIFVRELTHDEIIAEMAMRNECFVMIMI